MTGSAPPSAAPRRGRASRKAQASAAGPLGPTSHDAEANHPLETSVEPTARERWLRLRGPLVIVAVLVLGGVVSALLQAGTGGGPLDPRSARQPGGRALAVLLDQRGVDVRRVDTLDAAMRLAGTDTTLVVAQPDLLVSAQLDRLAGAPSRHLVLFAPGEKALTVLAPNAVPAGDALARTRVPGCALPAARRAGAVRVDGPMYRALPNSAASLCYGDGTRGGLLRLTDEPAAPAGQASADSGAGRTVDVVGMSTSFANSRLADDGNAALALNLLGGDRELVWYVPSLSDVPAPGTPGGEEPRSLTSLLPDGLRFGVGQAGVALALLMLAAARRLGPVVPEALPVVVRASEAVEGRARLYHRARARDRAAQALREATATRLSPLLGLPPNATPDALVAAVTARTGRAGTQVRGLLAAPDAGGTRPGDDGSLVRLADDLDTLEQEVRRS
ncbi:DUF4350 domain-containing protein [Actinopolymorpha pittospori]|uniref:DUF4350 domain-containing protein n=1 Tax=Actinopolymorpha pittospori TaxID=648752 RepID=A0A927MVU5_9ACTN|nr:hypothetical protein [Actinopolymorpha pittospori]